jgi:gas vesicle protein
MANQNNEFGAFLAGFVLGGLVGAAVSLLLAPQTGEDTRAEIHDRSIELRERATETAEQVRTRADEMVIEAQKRAEEMAAQSKTKADDLLKHSQTLLEEQKNKIETVVKARVKKDGQVVELPLDGLGESPVENTGEASATASE